MFKQTQALLQLTTHGGYVQIISMRWPEWHVNADILVSLVLAYSA